MCIICTKEKTMLCKECKNKTCLKTKKPCPEVEKELDSMATGKLPHTISLGGNYLDDVIVYNKETNNYRFKEKELNKAE